MVRGGITTGTRKRRDFVMRGGRTNGCWRSRTTKGESFGREIKLLRRGSALKVGVLGAEQMGFTG